MTACETVALRTLATPQGDFVVLWDAVAAGRTVLALVPSGRAQAYLDALTAGQEPDYAPQLVEQVGPELVPLSPLDQEIVTRCLALDNLSGLPGRA